MEVTVTNSSIRQNPTNFQSHRLTHPEWQYKNQLENIQPTLKLLSTMRKKLMTSEKWIAKSFCTQT